MSSKDKSGGATELMQPEGKDPKAKPPTLDGAPTETPANPGNGAELEAAKTRIAELEKELDKGGAKDAKKRIAELEKTLGERSTKLSNAKARCEQLTSALTERETQIAALDAHVRALQGELAEIKRGSAAAKTLTPLEGLPRGALRLLSSTVVIDAEGARVYAKRGDVVIPGGNTRALEAARKTVGERAKVYSCREEQVGDLINGTLAEQAG